MQYQRVTDRRTDGRNDRIAISISRVSSSMLTRDKNANKTNCVELIWKDEYPPNSSDLSPLEYHVWAAMLDIYQCYTTNPTNTYGGEERCGRDLSWLVSRPKLLQQYCRSEKAPSMQKARHLVATVLMTFLRKCQFSNKVFIGVTF